MDGIAQLLDDLAPVTLAVRTLAKKLDDTALQLNAEAFAAARTVDAVTKTPLPGPLCGQLSMSFANAGSNPSNLRNRRPILQHWPPSPKHSPACLWHSTPHLRHSRAS
ncbi:MAG: hypothetical protein HY646_05280 [Acidobacteria bacterium]|nr:hypothetical protein [Acidobacteriota bacterium]